MNPDWVTVKSCSVGYTPISNKPSDYIKSATFDKEHLNHPTRFLQLQGMFRNSSPKLVWFCEMTYLQKKPYQNSSSKCPWVNLWCLVFHTAKRTQCCITEIRKNTTYLLGIEAQEVRSQPVKWTVFILKNANDSHRKEPKPHSIITLIISSAVWTHFASFLTKGHYNANIKLHIVI